MKDSWKNKKVAILGFGVEGQSSSRYLKEQGAKLTILDERKEENLDTRQKATLEIAGVPYRGGEDYLDHLRDFDIIVRSPGISRFTKELLEAQKKGAKITSHTQIFMDTCPCSIIGVTGTKGKGTTSTLITEMLKTSSKDLVSVIDGVFLGGNIGTPPLDFLDEVTERSIVVLEMSSFQLEDITRSPHIAVMLMIVPEHLNHHADMEEYVSAKRNILRFQTKDDFAVINRDYIASNESDTHTDGKVFQVTRERTTTEQGSFVKDNALWIRVLDAEWKIIDLDEIALPGKHNWENAAAAAMAATLAGASKIDIEQVLRTFKGLEHRLELVGEKDGVRYFDDSFSTTPETAVAAIEAFSEPEIVILGGSSKKSEFSPLGDAIAHAKNIKVIIGIGEEWLTIKKTIEQKTKDRPIPLVMVEGAKDMETVVKAAAKVGAPGDIVLLSPACASFDMFKDYKDRGNQFKEEVTKL